MAQVLIIRQDGKPQQLLEKYVRLLLNYRYGCAVETVNDFIAAAHHLRKERDGIDCVFVIQSQAVSARSTIPALSANGRAPVFLLEPADVARRQREECAEMGHVHVCAWEEAFSKGESSLQEQIVAVMEEAAKLDQALAGAVKDKEEDAMARVLQRLDTLDTLPTVPAIVLRIMQLLRDPKVTVAQLEEMLCRDPAIVLKLLRVVNSPVFAGAGQKGRWTLKEALVRLGLRKVGAIAQQIALINNLVRPEQSEFDMKRYWQHSVGCALVADRLVEQKLVKAQGGLQFNDYWIAALLHDGGKLVLGFFFWDWFERIVRQMEREKKTFAEAEDDLGNVPHAEIGGLLLEKARAPKEMAEAVALHHAPGETPQPLVGLVHLADNLTKEMGLAYLEREPARYDRCVLQALGLKREDARRVQEQLAPSVRQDVSLLVNECMK